MNSAQVKQVLEAQAAKYNSNPRAFADYAVGAALGGAGQQLMNWGTDGSDPNPLISGLLGAPINRALMQTLRASSLGVGKASFNAGLKGMNVADPQVAADIYNQGARMGFGKYVQDAPIEVALGGASLLGAVPTGAATSIYNVATSGQDIDNNLTSFIGGLAALAPIAYMLIKKRQANQSALS